MVVVTSTRCTVVTLLSSVTDADHVKQVCDVKTCPVFAPAGKARATVVATATPATRPTRHILMRAIREIEFTAVLPSPTAAQNGTLIRTLT